MVKHPDSSIYENISKGSEADFNSLFDRYYTPLCFFGNRHLNDMDLSRSVVQDVFIDLWEKRDKLKINYSVKSYLYNAVRNRSIDYLRKEKVIIPLSDSLGDLQEAPFQDLVEEAELNNRINSTINKLPERCREVFVLCRFEGLKYAEIAEKMNISVKTVEMQMGIALKKLRKSLSDYQMVNLLVFIRSKKK